MSFTHEAPSIRLLFPQDNLNGILPSSFLTEIRESVESTTPEMSPSGL